jgi:large exoprotein involved in heme utilization and adhesion
VVAAEEAVVEAVAKETVAATSAKEAVAAVTAKEVMAAAVTKKATTETSLDGFGGGGLDVAHADAGNAPDATPNLKVGAKWATSSTDGSSPSPKQFRGSWSTRGPW